MLMKTSPYLYTLPDCLVKEVKSLTVQLQYLIIATALLTVELIGSKHISINMVERSLTLVGMVIPGVISIITAKFHLRMHSFLSMELCNVALFTIIIQESTLNVIDVFVTLTSLFFGMVLMFSLQTYCFQQKPFKWIHIGLTSAAVTTLCIYNITGFISVGISAGSFAFVWLLPFISAVHITVWVVLVFVVRCQRPCCRRRGLGYLLCAVLLSITVAMYGIMSIYFITDNIKNRDISGHCTVLALLHILTASALLDHPEKIQKLPHTILHLFGSSGLSIITSITLVTELILKSGTGLRTLPELHIIILPFDSLFTLGWITLQTYNSWLKMRSRIKSDFEDGRKADLQVGEGGEEMEVLSFQP